MKSFTKPRNRTMLLNVAGNREYSEERVRELILWIATELKDESGGIDEDKLQDILYFIDMEAFRQLGHSITGATYYKEPDYSVESEV